jgi:hypothetical protein
MEGGEGFPITSTPSGVFPLAYSLDIVLLT